MTAHSKLGASGMYRWARCPGSVALVEKLALPIFTSSYAAEGSDAHALAALCLTKNHNPGFYIGKTISPEGRKFTVTEEMAEAVQVYVDAVDAVIPDTSGGYEVQIEKRFDLSAVHPGCFGTADAVVWHAFSKTLYVFDYKHGAGVIVAGLVYAGIAQRVVAVGYGHYAGLQRYLLAFQENLLDS